MSMLSPEVFEILDDPEVGGGVSFTVKRTTSTKSKGSISNEDETFDVTGNIQPQAKTTQASTSEDILNESIVVYSTFIFQAGSNSGNTFIGADEILYNEKTYRVTQVNDWSDWGFSIAYATRVMG